MSTPKVMLRSSEGETFEVEEEVALESHMLKRVIEDMGIKDPLPLPNVSSKILVKVIEYCTYHVESRKSSYQEPALPYGKMQEWDARFVKVDYPILLGLIQAANYMEISNLLSLTAWVIVDMIKECRNAQDPGKEIQKKLNIPNGQSKP